MTRDVTVLEVQRAIADLTAWAHSTCPEWASEIVLALAHTVETILAARDQRIHYDDEERR